MKAYWEYTCDEGHSWTILRDYDGAEAPEDNICPYGHEAVTRTRELLIDAVQISIRPAGRIYQHPTGDRVTREYEFYLIVTDLHTGKERQAKQTYTWPQIKVLMDRFRNCPAHRAWQELDKLPSLSAGQAAT